MIIILSPRRLRRDSRHETCGSSNLICPLPSAASTNETISPSSPPRSDHTLPITDTQTSSKAAAHLVVIPRVSQFVGAADTALADSITGFLDGFESGQLEADTRWAEFRPSEQQHGAGSEEREYYTYSELPRAAY